MAICKANEVKRGSDGPKRAKASVRYIQHRAGKEGEKITRDLFGSDGLMDRYPVSYTHLTLPTIYSV